MAPLLGAAALKAPGETSDVYARAEFPGVTVLYPAIRSSGSIRSAHPGVVTEPQVVREATIGQDFVETVPLCARLGGQIVVRKHGIAQTVDRDPIEGTFRPMHKLHRVEVSRGEIRNRAITGAQT